MAAAMGVIGMGASLACGILGAEGAKQSAAATQQSYNYQAGVAKINSQIDLQNADYARNQGEIQATDFGLKAAQQEAQIKTAQSASNLDVNSGSNLDVQTSQHTVDQMDLTQIRSNAAKTAYDYDVKSTMDLNQSTLDIMGGQNAIAAGNIQAEASILGSVGSVASKWSQGSQSGMFGSSSSGSGPGLSLTGTGGLY
jgi:hypothetical protein